MNIRHKIYAAVSVFISSCMVLLMHAVTSAASNQNIIWCGLQAGANFDFTQIDACTSSSASSAGSTPNTANSTGTYAALGDSVAAGLGLQTTTGDVNAQCGRSSQSYPYQVAKATGLNLNHIACSGATAGDLVTKQSVSGPNITAQLDQAFAQGTPRLITITAGANDAHWADFIKSCYITDCSSSASTALANTYLKILQAKLLYAFSSIASRSSGQLPKVIITGYYNPVSASCNGKIPNVSNQEISWIGSETNALNQTIRQTAAQFSSFVTYAPVSFAGHDICSASSWVQGLNAAAPFHPTATGQSQIANAVIATYRQTD